MKSRLPAIVSLALHGGLLFLLSLITFSLRKDEVRENGVELELFEPGEEEKQSPAEASQSAAPGDPREQIRTVGDDEQAEAETPQAPAEPVPDQPVREDRVQPAPPETPVAPVISQAPGAIVPVESAGVDTALVDEPVAPVAPAAPPAPVAAISPSGEAPGGPQIIARPSPPRAVEPAPAPAPVTVAAATPAASGGAPTAAARSAPAQAARPRAAVDASRLASLIGVQRPAQRSGGVDSNALGRAIGRAQPSGAGRLSLRQRANLAEMVRNQITPCWNPPEAEEGAGRLSIVMRIKLDRQGALAEPPSVTSILGETPRNAPYSRALAGSVRRAVVRCAPLRLPPELYDAWSDIELNFDPRDLR